MKQDSVARIYLLTLAFVTVLWGQILVVPLLVILATVFAIFNPPRWKIRDDVWIAQLCILLGGMIAFRIVVPHDVLQRDWILPVWLILSIAEFLLVASALELFRYNADGKLPVYFPAWGLGLLICNHHHVGSDLQRYLFLLSALLCVFLAITFFQLNRTARVPRHQRRTKGQFSLLSILLLLIGMLSWQSYEVFAGTENSVLTWLLKQQKEIKKPELIYEGSGRLDAVTTLRQNNPDSIAIRVLAMDEPGYLRGRSYRVFNGNGWHPGSRERTERALGLVPLDAPNGVRDGIESARFGGKEKVFNMWLTTKQAPPSNVGPWQAMRVINNPTRGRHYFAPLNAHYVKGVNQTGLMKLDEDGIVKRGLDEGHAYTLYFREGENELGNHLQTQALLGRGNFVQSSHSILANELASNICFNATTDAEKIEAVEAYCQSNFKRRDPYAPSLLAEADRKRKDRSKNLELKELQDLNLAINQPLTHFLENKYPATSEFFATAAALLLREVDVETRYVTGYVVREYAPEDNAWQARNHDAHAWVEAYDNDAERWVTVEPTPGMKRGARRNAGGPGKKQEKLPSISQPRIRVQKVEEQGLYRRLQHMLGQFFGVPAILLLAASVAVAVYISRRIQNAVSQEQAWLTYVERKLGKHKLVRKSGETLHQFAERVKEYPYGDEQTPPLRDFADWLTRYAFFRYGVTPYGLDAPPERVR